MKVQIPWGAVIPWGLVVLLAVLLFLGRRGQDAALKRFQAEQIQHDTDMAKADSAVARLQLQVAEQRQAAFQSQVAAAAAEVEKDTAYVQIDRLIPDTLRPAFDAYHHAVEEELAMLRDAIRQLDSVIVWQDRALAIRETQLNATKVRLAEAIEGWEQAVHRRSVVWDVVEAGACMGSGYALAKDKVTPGLVAGGVCLLTALVGGSR